MLKNILKRFRTSKLLQNGLWLFALQVFNTVVPMATIPYVTRVLGTSGYGDFSLALNWILYFQVIVEYGFGFWGARKVAIRGKKHLQNTFSMIITARMLLAGLSVVIMCIVYMLSGKAIGHFICMLILFFMVMGTAFQMTWLFQGMQDMKYICYRQQIELEAGKEYVLSAYVKTENVVGDGAYVSLVSAQNGKTIKSVAVKGTTPAASENGMPADGWERVHVNLDLRGKTGVQNYKVELCLKGEGTAWFSCPQLEEGSIVSPVNLISNGDFRYEMESWAAGSNNLGEATDGVFSANSDPEFPSALSGKYIQLEGRPNKSYVLYNQIVDLQGTTGDCFVTGGWANAKSIPDASTASRGFGFAIRLKKSDDSWTNYKVMAFNEEWVGWQFGCWAYVAECNYKGLELALIYTHNCNLAKFSNIFLHREQFGQSYAYDDDKNIVSTGTLSGQKSDIKYDDADNIEKYTQPGRDASKDENQYIFKYYDSKDNIDNAEERKKHLMRQSRTPMKVTDCFTYDAYGNQLTSRRVDNSVVDGDMTSKPFIYTQTEYDTSGNYAIKTIDARGEVVEKEVDANTGLLFSVKDPNNQLVTYAYDDSKRVTEVKAIVTAEDEPDGSKTYVNNYAYENDRIKTVSHNTTGDTPDVTYTFNYDKLGRKTSVQVGSQVLSTNSYTNDRSGLLQMVEYGNNGKVEYDYDEYDRLETVKFDGEDQARYSYGYGSNGRAAEVRDNHLARVVRTEFDLADRPCQVETNDLQENPIYCTKLKYDKYSNLESFAEILPEANHKTEYAYDNDNRITSIAYDGSANNIAYEYDELGRIKKRTSAAANHNYVTEYEFVAATEAYGANATTPLVSKITQGSGDNTMDFEYSYDNRGNITDVVHTGDRTIQTTHYDYDALGQLVRVNDKTEFREGVVPEENETLPESSTWVYEYDCGGNILCKKKYGYTTAEEPTGECTTTSYTYGDPNWKDKLTSYDGKTITYDAIGNPLNDGVRTYTWGAGRQLRHISMLTGEEHGIRISNGIDEDSNTILRIVHDETNSKLKVKLLRDGRDITDECAASAFAWKKGESVEGAGKEITVTDAEINGDVQFSCTYTETQGVYGTVGVDNNLVASHDPATADVNHVFTLENGMLKVEIPNNAGNGTEYELVDGVLSVNPGFTGTITAEYAFTTSPTREIDFEYDHNGLRIQKKVVENGITTIYDYTLHGKLITHLTKRVVDLQGVESSEELHFFYDAQSRPAMVEYNGAMYSYLHNLQGDIIGIIDAEGNLVVEYKYDAWGNPLQVIDDTASDLDELNPFRYRGYVWDKETELYYLRSRYYAPEVSRFINSDILISKKHRLHSHNIYAYCFDSPICRKDEDGYSSVLVVIVFVGLVIILSGCERVDSKSAPNLDRNTASSGSYNCYGNAIGKRAVINPPGYNRGDSTRSVFEAVRQEIGEANVTEHNSLLDPIADDEYMVALKCGLDDYHFMVFDNGTVYNKQGKLPLADGCTIDCIQKDAWYTHFHTDEQKYQYSSILSGNRAYYDYETIYFSINRDWSNS